jgi:uncharacterized protein (DUF3820 family)
MLKTQARPPADKPETRGAVPDLVRRYVELFVINAQIHARQSSNGEYYYKVEEPVTYGLVHQHLAGEFTLAFYATSPYGEWVKWVCLDSDAEGGLGQLAALARKLKDAGIPGLLEASRRGGHLWMFFDRAPTIAVREYFQRVVGEEGLEVDIFPRTEEGLSCMRGPLGVHRKAGRRFPFLDIDTLKPISTRVYGNLEYLTQVERVDVARLAEGLARQLRRIDAEHAQDGRRRQYRSGREEIVAVKEGIGDLRQFIGRFVKLDAKGRGSCPFHPPDRHPSFSVQENFWVCFHETKPNGKYRGGDVIDFWMQYRDVDFPTALQQLEEFA